MMTIGTLIAFLNWSPLIKLSDYLINQSGTQMNVEVTYLLRIERPWYYKGVLK